MDKALIALLEKKDFAYISVKEICDAAGVNRSTFYLHYENTSDLLKEATQYILDSFLSYFSADTRSVTLCFTECPQNDLLYITPEYLTPYLTFIKENQKLFKTALKQMGQMDFEKVYERMLRHIFSPILSRFQIPEQQHTYVMKFYLSGVTAIAMEWIKGGCKDDMDTIIQVITDCIMGDRSIYGKNP